MRVTGVQSAAGAMSEKDRMACTAVSTKTVDANGEASDGSIH